MSMAFEEKSLNLKEIPNLFLYGSEENKKFSIKSNILIQKRKRAEESEKNNDSSSIEKNIVGCNCKNSGCLKRYCECFSRINYCDKNCKCQNCCNNIFNQKERNNAIKNYLIKSPISFKKKNMDLNNISCNCKKSNCLKNYCECFHLGLKCSKNCRCFDCRNKNMLDKKLFNVESYNEVPNKDENININKNPNVLLEKKINENIININENKNHNSVNFIVDKNYINNKPIKNSRYNSYDKSFEWNNLNLKRIHISKAKLIIDNYNINNINNCNLISIQMFQPKIKKDLIKKIVNNNGNIIINKNSAFNVML